MGSRSVSQPRTAINDAYIDTHTHIYIYIYYHGHETKVPAKRTPGVIFRLAEPLSELEQGVSQLGIRSCGKRIKVSPWGSHMRLVAPMVCWRVEQRSSMWYDTGVAYCPEKLTERKCVGMWVYV